LQINGLSMQLLGGIQALFRIVQNRALLLNLGVDVEQIFIGIIVAQSQKLDAALLLVFEHCPQCLSTHFDSELNYGILIRTLMPVTGGLVIGIPGTVRPGEKVG